MIDVKLIRELKESKGKLFEEDKNAFKPLPDYKFEINKIEKAKCNKYGIIQIDKKTIFSCTKLFTKRGLGIYLP